MDTRAPIAPDHAAEIARRLADGFDLEAFAALSQKVSFGDLATVSLLLAMVYFGGALALVGAVPRPPRTTAAATGATTLLLLLSALSPTPIAWPVILAPMLIQILLWAVAKAIATVEGAAAILARLASLPVLAALRVRVALALATPAALVGSTTAFLAAAAVGLDLFGADAFARGAIVAATAAGLMFAACICCALATHAPRRFLPSE